MSEKFLLCSIDTTTASKADIEAEIQRLSHMMVDKKNEEQSLKIFLNSMYGAIGNQYFVCYNTDIAEAITLQGQHLIKFTTNITNKYFMEEWNDDIELHKQLGITVSSNATKQLVKYIDTDSAYISFQEIVDSVDNFEDLNITPVEFVQKLYAVKLKGFFNDRLINYAKRWNTKNVQDFELEMVSYSGLWTAKKKYILDVAWTDRGINYKPQEKIKPTGVELVQTGTSKFIRTRLKEIVTEIFVKGDDLDISDLTSRLKKMKNKFKMMDIEEISMAKKINDYDKSVVSDKNKLRLRSGCPIHVRASAIHNWMVNSKKEYRQKYSLIKSGDKIKFYYTKNKSDALNVIAYMPGYMPFEFIEEFPFDYDTMFEHTVLSPINRILKAIGKTEIPKNLVTVKGLLSGKV